MTTNARRKKWRKRFRIAQACDLINNKPGTPDDEIWFNYQQVVDALAEVPIQRNGSNGNACLMVPNQLNFLIRHLVTSGVLEYEEAKSSAPFIKGVSDAGRRCRLYRVISNEKLTEYLALTSTEMKRR